MQRAALILHNVTAADGTPQRLEIESKTTDLLTALDNELYLNPAIFARLDSLYSQRHTLNLTAEQVRLIERTHQRFVLAGAVLNDADRQELAALNLEIAKAQTEFSQQVTQDLNAAALHITDEAELAGLSTAQKQSARQAAENAGKTEGWLLTFELPTQQPLLSSLENRETRRRLYTASTERGSQTWDMAANIAALRARKAALRARKAALLGFDDFASLAVADRTAQTPAAVDQLFAQTIAPAMANADREAEKSSN